MSALSAPSLRLVEFECDGDMSHERIGESSEFRRCWTWHNRVTINLDLVGSARPFDDGVTRITVGCEAAFNIKIGYPEFCRLWHPA